MRIREAQKHTDPTEPDLDADPDPQHCQVAQETHCPVQVYTFNPAFRAERGRTRRHLTEFWMVEAELAFCQDLDQLFRLMEQLIRHVARSVLDTSSADLALYAKAAGLSVSPLSNIESLLAGSPFHRITFRLVKNFLRARLLYNFNVDSHTMGLCC
jgi:aspartyl/asparaginyl-tRNA synthetase